jgi:hypothetical protein
VSGYYEDGEKALNWVYFDENGEIIKLETN